MVVNAVLFKLFFYLKPTLFEPLLGPRLFRLPSRETASAELFAASLELGFCTELKFELAPVIDRLAFAR